MSLSKKNRLRVPTLMPVLTYLFNCTRCYRPNETPLRFTFTVGDNQRRTFKRQSEQRVRYNGQLRRISN